MRHLQGTHTRATFLRENTQGSAVAWILLAGILDWNERNENYKSNNFLLLHHLPLLTANILLQRMIHQQQRLLVIR